jgi:formylglycine-generating enzyme required for sulfatase activity
VPPEESGDHPVGGITRADAITFCEWLRQKERHNYRLPTDREWSFAVGIGHLEPAGVLPTDLDEKIPGVYPWGSQWPPPKGAGNFADAATKVRFPPGSNSAMTSYISEYDDGYPTTAPVMRFTPNRIGLYDLAGNVMEWCSDTSPENASGHLLRGGSWKNGRTRHLSSFRFGWTNKNLSYFGFRVALEIPGRQ